MNARQTVGCMAALLGCGAAPAWADAVAAFQHSWLGQTTFEMSNLAGGGGVAGSSNFFFNAPPRYPANEDHLNRNWWFVRLTLQTRNAAGVWVDTAADPDEFVLGGDGAPQDQVGARTRDFPAVPRVQLGYDALPPAGSPAGIGPQLIDIKYQLAQTGQVYYDFRVRKPAGLAANERMRMDLFWLVDIDAHGTDVNDRVLAGKSGKVIAAIFDDSPVWVAPIFVGARAKVGTQVDQSFRAKIDTYGNLRDLMEDGAATNLNEGLENLAIGAAGDWAILFQWKIVNSTPGLRGEGEEYEPYEEEYYVEYQTESDVCMGDLDGDHLVSIGDLAMVLANFGRQGELTPGDGDIDYDGDVDLDDLSRLLANFGRVC